MLIYERISILLLITANVLYSLACFSHSWFQLPDVSYGLWVARYCDYLSCQIIPAFFTEEPVWYHVLQALGLFGWSGMVGSLILLTSKKFDTSIPKSWKYHKQLTVSALCIISVFVISLCLVMFYGKLDESHTSVSPKIQWSAFLAAAACILQFCAGLLLTQV
ncbi:uncharacterized protein LOC133183767 [Saccostrea echinata]|uniref:uncharacterized protein LOC133183767 n=1 Tax=Saccostrea echinata TaxID=191078 RepID=UPI002A82AFBF|nr:uncharacterized protein LOC133183767 [Saccostrea echinata]